MPTYFLPWYPISPTLKKRKISHRFYEAPHPARVLAQKLIQGAEVLPFKKEPEEKPTREAPEYIPEAKE